LEDIFFKFPATLNAKNEWKISEFNLGDGLGLGGRRGHEVGDGGAVLEADLMNQLRQ
jgi:hypothetical protein